MGVFKECHTSAFLLDVQTANSKEQISVESQKSSQIQNFFLKDFC